MKLSKAKILDWILSEQISVKFGYPMAWVNPDGSMFRSNWSIDSPTTRFATYPTIEESLEKAYETYYKYVKPLEMK